MKSIALVLVIAMTLPAFAEWTPPEKPDPQAILQEAQADTAAKRYEDALAKHLWFHRNALSHDRALYGVRLSFALRYWKELGKSYPPAHAKLKTVRDDARKAITSAEPKDANEPFHDFVAINRTLGENSETNALFAQLDKEESPVAKEVFHLAMPLLIRAKEYGLCGKYLEPKSAFENSRNLFNTNRRLANDPKFGDRLQQFAENKFTNDTTTLVALLIVNDRKPEAAQIAAQAKKEWANDAFHAAIDKALQGVVPKPWP